jgi:transcriptional adapter 3
MAPPSSQKGTGKKGGAGAMRQQQQRSRNTTPSAVPSIASLPPIESVEAETVGLHFEVIRNLTYEDMVDPSASGSAIPDSKGLDGILSRLQKLSTLIETRGSYCDRGMRLLAQVRKHRQDEERGMEEERRQKGIDDEERERKANKKKRKATENLAPQGGSIGQSVFFTAVFFFLFLALFFLSGSFCWQPYLSFFRWWSPRDAGLYPTTHLAIPL